MDTGALIWEGLLDMVLGMGFVFLFLGVLVGFMRLVAYGPGVPAEGGGPSGKGPGADLEGEETLSVMALSEYETGRSLDPGVAAAIGMALFQALDDRAGAGAAEAERIAGGAWKASGRNKIMSQREMWFWRGR